MQANTSDPELPTSQLWINGAPCASSTRTTFDVINPGSQAVVGRAACASSEDAMAAILAADAAQPAWEAVPAFTKRDILLKAAELLQSPKYYDRALVAVQEETGALEEWAIAEVKTGAWGLCDAAFTATQIRGETMPSGRSQGGTVLIERRPLGAVLAITPFNSPINLAVRAVAIAIACGNTVVLKTSESSPRCAEIVVELLYEAGLPRGVLNLLHIVRSDTPRIVAEIIGHKLIRHINFTGSDRVGKILAAEAAKHLKPCVLELGGKSAAVVLNDANVEEAARSIIFGAMLHSGQICMSNERVIVQRTISKQLIAALTSLTRKIHAGTSPSAHLPPLISSNSASNVLSLITDAHSRGAEVLVGDLKHNGAVLQPHIILGVEPGWPLWEKESFGPVFGIKVVDTEDEAVEMANKTDYSLMGAVWTRDIDKGLKIARRIRAGQVLINAPTFFPELAVGLHGLGGSTGYGRFDIENFTQRRTVSIIEPGLELPLVSGL